MVLEKLRSWIITPDNADQDGEKKQQFLYSGKYETTRLQALGFSNGTLKSRAKQFYHDNQDLSLETLRPEINKVMTESTLYEYQLLCLFVLEHYHNQFDFPFFIMIDEAWIDLIDYWAIADHLSMNVCMHFPLETLAYQARIRNWIESENYWRRRLSLTIYVKRARSVPDLFPIILSTADQLLDETNHYIRKAISWVIRDGYRKHDELYNRAYEFVSRNISRFTKTMLRETIRYLSDSRQQELLDEYESGN